MAQEKIEVLDGACKPRKLVVTRHEIEHDVSALLKRGLTTTSAGGFFFIPYLLQLGGHALAASLGPAKQEGIPKERIALGIVFESIFGYKAGIHAVDSVNRADFGLLAGLPFLPSASTQYRFLQQVPVKDGLDFQTTLGKRLVALGQVTPGCAVNVDGHNLKTFSRKEMKLSFLTKEDRYGKAIRTFFTPRIRSRRSLLSPWLPIPERPSRRSPASWPLGLMISSAAISSWSPIRSGTAANSSRNSTNSMVLQY